MFDFACFERRGAVAIAAAVACSASALHAQNVDIPARPVNVIGNYDTSIGSTNAASAGTVTERVIETRPILRPGELLEFVPGVIVTQHAGDGKANQYFLRGFNLDHGTDFSINVAGMPVNLPTHAHGQGYSDLSFMIPELVNRIDYRKGPYYAQDGDFGSAGSVHMQYFDDLPKNTAAVTLGSFDYKRALLTGGPEVGPGRLVYGLEYVGTDGPWTVPENYRKLNGVLKYVQGSQADGFNVTAMAYGGSWDSTDQIAMRAVDRGEIGRFDSLDPTTGGNSSRYSLSGARYADFAGGRWEVDAYMIRYKLNLFSNFTYYLDRDQGDQFEQADSRTVVGIHPRATFFGKLGSFDTVNRIGLQGRFDDIGQVALYDTVARQRVGPTSDDKVRQGSVGIYGDNSTKWNPWFRSVVGLRADFYRFNVSSSTPANSGNLNDAIVSPKLSLIFGPWSRTEFFINYGQGFHSNDARGTTITVDPKTGDPAAQVSPLVKSRGSEIGARTEFIPGLQSSLTLWQLKLDSELLFVGDAGTTEPTRPSQREGVEWSNHYVNRSGWLVDLQLAWSKSRFVGDAPEGNYIPGSIVTVAAFGVTYDPGGKWFAAMQTRYFGPRPLTEDNSVQSSSTNLTNLRLGYRIDKTWQVRLDLLNVLNRKKSDIEYYYPSCLSSELAGGAYANPACTGAAGTRTGVNDIHFHPVEPFAARVTVSASF